MEKNLSKGTEPRRHIEIDPAALVFAAWEKHAPIDRPDSFSIDAQQVFERFTGQLTDKTHANYVRFRRETAPKLTTAEREQLRVAFAPVIDPLAGLDMYSPYNPSYYMAALVGCSAEVKACVANIDDEAFIHGDYHYWGADPQWLLFGLPSREELISEFRRVRLSLRCEDSFRVWLALTEFDGLDLLADSICALTNKGDAAKLAKIIHQIIAPEMALPVLQIATSSKAPQVAREWLSNHPLETTIGLAQTAATGTSNLAKAAREHLATLSTEIVELAKPHIDPNIHAKLTAKIEAVGGIQLDEIPSAQLPAALQEEFAKIKPGRLPKFVNLSALPQIQVAGRKLAEDALKLLITALRANNIPKTSPLFAQLKKHAEPNSLDQFAWKLFEAWTGNGHPADHKWAMGAIGHLGGEHCIHQLTPLIRKWPAASAHQRSIFALDCLRAIGSDTALMTLSTVGTKLKYKSVKTKAHETMNEIAADRGISREALGDCIIPNCGLDQNGRRSFDYGPRQFEFALDTASRPKLRDSAGKLRATPPKPNKADDPLMAEAAIADWKTFRKSLQQTLKIQAERMGDAMVAGRTWSADAFEKLFIRHPFMLHLARQLVFGSLSEGGDLLQSFRVTEDQSLADVEEEELSLPHDSKVCVLHPAKLSESERAQWVELLSDYAIIPPFPQMDREIFPPLPEELEHSKLQRHFGQELENFIAYRILRNSGWSADWDDFRGPEEHYKYYAAADTTAIMQHSDGRVADTLLFVAGRITNPRKRKPLRIREVDLVAFSETLRTVKTITVK